MASTGQEGKLQEIPAPDLVWRPPTPDPPARVGLLGCGSIAETHLRSYQDAGVQVVALCSRDQNKARHYAERFCPQAEIAADPEQLFARSDLDAVDLTPHAAVRLPLIEQALAAGQHVLSQKPLATDLASARLLVACAERHGRLLAVNQNGRWAPHFAWMRQAVLAGHVGQVTAIRQEVRWDHNWIFGLAFDQDPHVVLEDFGIHWFDFVASLLPGRTPKRIRASEAHSPGQTARPPLSATAQLDFEGVQVSLVFEGNTREKQTESTLIIGTKGRLESRGAPLDGQELILTTAAGRARAPLSGRWFPDAFAHSLHELVRAVRDPSASARPLHDARENLRSLEWCFAAVEAAEGGS
ncbi:MAG: putative dehydrogenase [Planctomycetota bacterium]|jgi:predicted dehydrogenase